MPEFPKTAKGMISGRITDEEAARIVARLIEKKISENCELCGAHKSWELVEYLVTTIGIARHPDHLTIAPGDPFLPLMPLVCQNCGNTKLLNIKILGFEKELFPYEK